MAGAGYKLFQTGDVLTAAQVNTYLNEQTVMVFANAAARTSALTSVLAEGMVSYLQDTNAVEVYNGSAWVGVSGAGDVTEVQAGTGISVASGTGPIPVVTNTVATAYDAKADLIVGTGADTFAKLTVGANGTVLTADSSVSPTGLKWATPAGGGSALTFITSATPSSSSGQSFNNCFSATYQNYMIVLNLICSTDDKELQFRLRSSGTDDSSSNYNYQVLAVYGTTVGAARSTSQTFARIGTIDDTAQMGYVMYVYRPFESTPTATLSDGVVPHDSVRINKNAATFTSSTSFDGITIYPSSDTMTGTIRIYGIANS